MNDFEKNNFADFTASSAMKDIGFDEPCIAIFNGDVFILSVKGKNYDYSHTKGLVITSPMFTQARKWFREKHQLEIITEITTHNNPFIYSIRDLERHRNQIFTGIVAHGHSFHTEPDAYNAAIIHAAKIVKEKQNG